MTNMTTTNAIMSGTYSALFSSLSFVAVSRRTVAVVVAWWVVVAVGITLAMVVVVVLLNISNTPSPCNNKKIFKHLNTLHSYTCTIPCMHTRAQKKAKVFSYCTKWSHRPSYAGLPVC